MASLTKPDPFFLSAYKQFIEDSFPKAAVVLDLAGLLGRCFMVGKPADGG
jgi:hypothetical protein